MTTLYYLDGNLGQTADLTICDARTGVACELDVLDNMDWLHATGIHRTPECEEDCATHEARCALAVNAEYYADDPATARWWIEYVEGYRATMDDQDALREALDELDEAQLTRVALTQLGERLVGQLPIHELPGAILRALGADARDYDAERAEFVGDRDDLWAIIDQVRV